MHFQYTPYILPLILSSIIATSVALYVWERRALVSGGVALSLLALACAEWSLGYALEIAGSDLVTEITWGKIQYIGIVSVPLLWIIFTYSYATQGPRMTRRVIGLLSIIPGITLLLALTTELHHLIWVSAQTHDAGAFSVLQVTHGLWFWIYWVYSYILLIAGTIFVLLSLKRTRGLLRTQNVILLIAVLIPWLGNALYISGLSPIPDLDFTPFAFTISIVVFTWGIFSFKLVNLAPVARDLVIERMRDGMVVLDVQGNIVDINTAVQATLGLTASQVIGRRGRDVFQAWPSLVERYENTLEAQDEIVVDEGENRIWYEIRMSPLYNNDERLLGRVMTVRDITEKKQAEEALRRSEEKYRNIYENVADVIYETDNQGHLISISPSIQKRAGYRPEELIGRSVIDFFVFPEQYAALDALMLETGSANDFEVLLRRKDGSEIFTSITSHILFDEHGQGVATEGVLRDISERKQAEERIRQMNAELESRVVERTSQLQESNAYLTSLIETSIALNESLDLNEVLDRILAQAQKLIPAQALEVMFIAGEHASIVRRIGYEGRENIAQGLLDMHFPTAWPTFHQMVTTQKSIHIADTSLEPGWQIIQNLEWLRSYIGVPLVVSEETIGFLNACHSQPDFFQPKHVQMLEALAHHASVAIQNARLIGELKRALEKEQSMRNQLVQADKLAALGKMVSVIAHEINNPIQTVKNTLYLLEDQVAPEGPAQEYLKMASAEANRIADLVKQLRGTYASGSQSVEQVNLPDILVEVHELLAPQLKKKQVEWCQAEELQPQMVSAVRSSLKQVFINLCLNAMEAMEVEAGGRLTVKVYTSPNGLRVGIDFHNTGPSIPEESLPFIFDPFFTTKPNGTGLGLSISYDIIRQHQGEIVVESLPGKGVTFTVWLPLAQAPEQGGKYELTALHPDRR